MSCGMCESPQVYSCEKFRCHKSSIGEAWLKCTDLGVWVMHVRNLKSVETVWPVSYCPWCGRELEGEDDE